MDWHEGMPNQAQTCEFCFHSRLFYHWLCAWKIRSICKCWLLPSQECTTQKIFQHWFMRTTAGLCCPLQHYVFTFLTLSSGSSLAFIRGKIKQAEYPMSGLSESSLIPINKHSRIYSPGTWSALANAPTFYRWVTCPMWITAAITEQHSVISMFHVNLHRKWS